MSIYYMEIEMKKLVIAAVAFCAIITGVAISIYATPHAGTQRELIGTEHNSLSSINDTIKNNWASKDTGSFWDIWANNGIWVQPGTAMKAENYTVDLNSTNEEADEDINAPTKGVFFNITATSPAPEPATMLLFGIAIAGLAGVIRKKRN